MDLRYVYILNPLFMYKLFPKTYMTKSTTSTQFYMNFTFKV